MRSAISFRLRLAVLVTMAMAAFPCFAGEVAVLRNGFSIRHERREVVGDLTRLYVSADGANFIDVPTADIEHYEDAPPELPSEASDSRLAASGAKRVSSPFPRNAPSAPSVNLDEVVSSASGRYRLDPDLVNSVIKAESGFNARAVSPKGAQGLMQLMPGTASTLGVPNAFDPEANVEGGTKYLRELLERYNFDLVKALAAYNAGPQRVEQFNGVPPYHETRAYVARIVKDFNKKKAAQQNAGASSVAKSRVPKRTGAKASTAAGKAPGSSLVQSKVNTAQSNE
ncbi:MAG TPA: lytic transglycosylase domain-containing protein [Candidatus Sulfotelmatobacter sp.]